MSVKRRYVISFVELSEFVQCTGEMCNLMREFFGAKGWLPYRSLRRIALHQSMLPVPHK